MDSLARWERNSATAPAPQIDILRRALEVLGAKADEVIFVPPSERTIADWRALRLLLQPELARLAGMATSHVSLVENGAMGLTAAVKESLATALQLPPEEIQAAWERARNRP